MRKYFALLISLLFIIIIMGWFSKSKDYKEVSQYSNEWSVAQSEYNGNAMFIRYRKDAKEIAGHPSYPFQIGVAIPLLNPNEQKLPTNEESEKLNAIEDDLLTTLTKDNEAFDVLVITTGGMREFVYYTKEWKPEYFDNKVKEIGERHKEHQLQFMMQKDEKWGTVTSLVP